MEINLQKILDAISNLTELVKSQDKNQGSFRSETLDLLFTALAKAQTDMPIAGLNSANPYFKSKYADLAELVRASRPSLTKNGLSINQIIVSHDDGQNVLHTLLGHSSGQWIESRMRIVPPKNDIQTIGSYITYLKRYAYASLVGVVSGNEDDDGEVAMAEARQIIAKGPSMKYDPKQQSMDTITKEQLEEMEYELAQYPDLAEEIMSRMQLQSLADLPKSKFQISMQRIREIKDLRNNGVKR